MKLTIKRRKNIFGRSCVAPFINGQNIWDIEQKHWVTSVQEAVLSAYRHGYLAALNDANQLRENPARPLISVWEEE